LVLAEANGWGVGYLDEVWWSRLAQPRMHSWSENKQPIRQEEFSRDKSDPDPKALCCYGMLDADRKQLRLRFVDGRPVSHVTTAFLAWLCERVAAEGKQTLLLIWDNASWHVSMEVMTWIRQHNQEVLQLRRQGESPPGIQLVPCWLPVKSPWLNRIEPYWIHGKRAVMEPARLLTAQELIQRICDHFQCEHVEHLTQKVS
jgi:transposase